MAGLPPPHQRAEIARQARERFVAEMDRAMLELGKLVQERLTALMNEAAPSRELQSRRDAWTFYQRSQTAWVDGTRKDWLAALKPKPSLAPAQNPLSDDLALVETDVMDKQILASRLALGIMEKVGAEFNDLSLRIRLLESSSDLDAADIFRPEMLATLMLEQWGKSGMPRDAWPKVNDLAQKFFGQRILQAYVDCNAFLIRQGVLPTIELADRVRRVPAAAPRAQSPRAPASAQVPIDKTATREFQTGSGGAGDTSGASHSEALGQSRSGASSFGRQGLGFEGVPEETRMMTSATPLARARSRAQGVMGQLKRLLMGSGGTQFEATHFQPPSPALAAAIAVPSRPAPASGGGSHVVEDYSAAGVVRVAGELRQQTSELKAKAETKSEKATIEIVALMFQSILQEDRIPAGIRVWFARLQMPVLRVALAEPDFFGTLNHPARLLIDRMGSCVMGFDASGINGSALETEIKRVVQVIEQYPETGKRVYQLVYDEFQKFLKHFLTDTAVTQKVVGVAQQVEQKETLTIQYTIEMRNMLKDMPVRDEIREFLFKVWAEVLAVVAVRKGPQHAETLTLKKSATDLVWAASAKPNRSDRARVIQDLPQLLQKLRAGMSMLGVAPSAQEGYVKTISDTLADAFLSKTQAIPDEQIQVMASRLANLEDFLSDEGMGDLPLDSQSIEMMLGIDASQIEVVADGGSKPTAAMSAWAQELELGSWFTLDHNGQVAQVQFLWRSERKHLNLFAATNGLSYLIQAGRLAAYLQAGLLLPQEEEALTVRATRDALTKLAANPERLLG